MKAWGVAQPVEEECAHLVMSETKEGGRPKKVNEYNLYIRNRMLPPSEGKRMASYVWNWSIYNFLIYVSEPEQRI
jgi:hypothetical protein